MRGKLIFGLLSLIFIVSRLYGINYLPLFSDEAYAIIRAEELHDGGPMLGMIRNTTQPVLIWIIALFQFLPIPVLLASRLVSICFGLGSAILLSKISQRFIHPSSAPLAFLFSLFLPFMQFYDRTILFESGVLFWTIATLIIPVAALPLAVLTKATGILGIPLVVGIWWRKKGVLLKTLLLTCFVPLTVWLIALGGLQGVENIFQKTATPLSFSVPVKENILRAKLWLIAYITKPILLLSIFGMVGTLLPFLQFKNRRSLLVLLVWTIFVLLFETTTAKIFYPRYLYPMILGFILFATAGYWILFSFMKKLFLKKTCYALSTLLLIFILFPSANFLYAIATDPSDAPLPREDRFQFFEDWTSGVGSQELLDAIASKFPSGAHVYLEEENSYSVTLRQNSQLSLRVTPWLQDPLGEIPKAVMQEEGVTLFIRNRHPDIPDDWSVELVAEIPKTATRSVYLYRILKP